MMKFVVAFFMFIAAASAGYIGAPLAYTAPIVTAPIVKTAIPVATSYQNTYKISAAPVPVVVKAAPVIAAPIHYAPPVVHYAAPTIIKSPLLAYH